MRRAAGQPRRSVELLRPYDGGEVPEAIALRGQPVDETRTKLDWFKSIILPHQSALRARLRRINIDAQDVDDLVSEILTRAYANPNWRAVGHGRAYLFTVARNYVIDLTRRTKVVSFETIAELDVLQSGQALESQLCARDQLRRIQLVLDALPPQCRRVFVLRRIEEKSMAEIAEEMCLSVSTVEKHLGKAARLFMQALAEQEDRGSEWARQADVGEGAAAGRASRRHAQP